MSDLHSDYNHKPRTPRPNYSSLGQPDSYRSRQDEPEQPERPAAPGGRRNAPAPAGGGQPNPIVAFLTTKNGKKLSMQGILRNRVLPLGAALLLLIVIVAIAAAAAKGGNKAEVRAAVVEQGILEETLRIDKAYLKYSDQKIFVSFIDNNYANEGISMLTSEARIPNPAAPDKPIACYINNISGFESDNEIVTELAEALDLEITEGETQNVITLAVQTNEGETFPIEDKSVISLDIVIRASGAKALNVPSSAVFTKDGQAYVFKIVKNKAQSVPVTTDIVSGGRTEISGEGIAKDDYVIASVEGGAVSSVESGAKVKVLNEETAKAD